MRCGTEKTHAATRPVAASAPAAAHHMAERGPAPQTVRLCVSTVIWRPLAKAHHPFRAGGRRPFGRLSRMNAATVEAVGIR